jgi:hypothetical protein
MCAAGCHDLARMSLAFVQRRKKTFIFLVLVLAIVAVPVSCEIHVQRAYAEVAARWPLEAAEERARAAKATSPVLRGEPLDENAVVLYRPILAKLDDDRLDGDVAKIGSTASVAIIASHLAELAALREVVRCRRCDWELALPPDFTGVYQHIQRPLARAEKLLRLEAHARVKAGDRRGAADGLIDATRVGLDEVWGAAWAATECVAELSNLVASENGAGLDAAEIERALDRLERALSRPEDDVRSARVRCFAWLATVPPEEVPEKLGEELPAWATIVPRRILVTHAVVEIDRLWREAEEDAASGDIERWARGAEAIHERGERVPGAPSWNPLVRSCYPGPGWSDASNNIRTRIALARVALALERKGKPFDARGVGLPQDPFHRDAKLQLAIDHDGQSYKIWSPGPLRFHDGFPEDRSVVLTRQR